jgi:hypothetical protein
MFPFWAIPPPLPVPCQCGDTLSSSCDGIGLRNHRNIVPFRDLPDENEVDKDYYEMGEFMYHAKRHWAVAGEIVESNFFIRPRAKIKTRFGEEVLVNFHLETAEEPKYFGWNLLKRGNTMIILYPYRRTFLDMNQGIRQENAETVMVFQAGLEKVTTEVASFKHCSTGKCFVCQAEKCNDGTPLKRCAQCKMTTYCSRECQISHWKGRHKPLCSQSGMLSKLAGLDFTTFNGYIDWSFQPERFDREAQKGCGR